MPATGDALASVQSSIDSAFINNSMVSNQLAKLNNLTRNRLMLSLDGSHLILEMLTSIFRSLSTRMLYFVVLEIFIDNFAVSTTHQPRAPDFLCKLTGIMSDLCTLTHQAARIHPHILTRLPLTKEIPCTFD